MLFFREPPPSPELFTSSKTLAWREGTFFFLQCPYDHRLWSAEMTGWRVQSKTLSEWKATLQSHLEKVAPQYNNSRNENDSEGHTASFLSTFWYSGSLLWSFEDKHEFSTSGRGTEAINCTDTKNPPTLWHLSFTSTWCKNSWFLFYFIFFFKINMLGCCYWRIRPSEGMIAPLVWVHIKSGSVP